MKQLVLKITVFDLGGHVLFDVPTASIQNVQSCIDLFHKKGTRIELNFEEIDAQSPVNN